MLTCGIPPGFRGGVHMKPPYAIGSVPSLSGHAVAYRWRSLPRVRRHRASKPQGSSERVLPWQITMDQLIFASLSHTHYWYEVGTLKVPADIPLWDGNSCTCIHSVCLFVSLCMLTADDKGPQRAIKRLFPILPPIIKYCKVACHPAGSH